jgi:hypothetical protein
MMGAPPMRNSIAPFVAFTLAVVASACSQSSSPVSPSAVSVPAIAGSSQLAAKAGKIDVCHRTGSGFDLITINDNAWPAHQGHGDGLPLGPVPGSASSFDSACVAISAPAVLSASPATLDFGSVAVGTTSGLRVITVKNTGGSPASHLGGVMITPMQNDFVVVSNTCTPQVAGILDPNETCEVAIRFAPESAGARAATFTISTEVTGPVSVALTGTGTAAAALSFFPSSLTFASQPSGSVSAAQSVTVVNSSTGTVGISSIALAGVNAAEFEVTNTCGAEISAGAFCSLSVVFHPASPGAKTATVNVVTAGGLQQVSLSGTGS